MKTYTISKPVAVAGLPETVRASSENHALFKLSPLIEAEAREMTGCYGDEMSQQAIEVSIELAEEIRAALVAQRQSWFVCTDEKFGDDSPIHAVDRDEIIEDMDAILDGWAREQVEEWGDSQDELVAERKAELQKELFDSLLEVASDKVPVDISDRDAIIEAIIEEGYGRTIVAAVADYCGARRCISEFNADELIINVASRRSGVVLYVDEGLQLLIAALSDELTLEQAVPTSRVLEGTKDSWAAEEWVQHGSNMYGCRAEIYYLFSKDEVTGIERPEDLPWASSISQIYVK